MVGCGKMKKGGSAKSGAGVSPQMPATFAPKKDVAGFKKGGSVKHDDAAQDKKLIAAMIKKSEKNEPAGMKKGGSACYKAGGSIKNNTDKSWPEAKAGVKVKADKTPPVDDTKNTFGNVKVKHSYESNGAAVKKLPLKLAAGGAAKDRRGDFKNIKHQPVPKKK